MPVFDSTTDFVSPSLFSQVKK